MVVNTHVFDELANADILQEFTQVVAGGPDHATQGIQAAAARNGAGGLMLQVSPAGGITTWTSKRFRKFVGDRGNTFIAQFPFNSPSVMANLLTSACILAVWQGGSVQFTVGLNPNGTISVYRGDFAQLLGTTSQAISQALWKYLKIKVVIHDSTGTVRVDFGATTVLNLSGQDTKATSSASWDEYQFGPIRQVTAATDIKWYVDEVLVMDGQGSLYNDIVAEHEGRWCPALAEGAHTDSTPLSGSDRAAMVDDAPADGDGTYNALAAAGDRDSFTIANWPASGPIGPVHVIAQVRKDDAGAASIKLGVRVGTTDSDGAEQSLAQTYDVLRQIFEQDPVNTVAWQGGVAPEVMVKRES